MLALTLNSTFDGLDQNNGNPPDSFVAAGPANLLATVNRELALFDKDGNVLSQSSGVNFFPDAQTANFNSTFDPWSVFDPYSQRYFVMFEEVEMGSENADGSGDQVTGGFGADEANLLIAISTSDEPGDLSNTDGDVDWIFLDPIDATTTNFGADAWIDYPKIATDADSIYVTGNFFPFGSGDFAGAQIIRLDKLDALQGVTTIDARIDAVFDGEIIATLQPAQSLDKPPGEPQLFVSRDNGNAGVDVWALDDANSFDRVGNNLGSSFTQYSGGVPQQGSPERLDSLSARLMNAVERNGTIWTTHTVSVEDEATVRWYEISHSAAGATLAQQGNVDPGTDIHTFMPAINADRSGNMVLAFNQSGPNEFASFRATGRQSGQPAGFTHTPVLISTGTTAFARGVDVEVQRWGDYTGLAIDPQDYHTFWAFGEVALSETTWTTQFGQLELSPMRLDQFDAVLPNNSLSTATVLGSLPQVTLQDLTIHDESDTDYFKITAHQTGKLVVSAYFQDALGDVDIRVFDATGNRIAASTSTTDNEQLVIPVVSQEMYFVRVDGFNDATNLYDLEIENFAAPTPTAVHLNPADDTGMMNNDNVTSETQPQFLIQVDLGNFENMGIAIDPPAGTPGADVEVTLVGTNTGTLITGGATRIVGPLWTFTPAAALADDVYFVSAAVKITDGQTPAVMGNGPLSPPLWITIDALAAAAPAAADLLSSSDSGMSDTDDVTNKMQPAFAGTVGPNDKVRVFAQKVGTAVVELVGQGVANSDGTWEVTVEPLVDGPYDITVRTEDAAGLLSAPSEPLRIWIDTAVPNTPHIDLITDTGRNDADNVTLDATPTLVLTGDDTVNGNGNPFPNDVKYRLYDRPGAATGEVLLYDSFTVIPGFTTAGQISFTPATALTDGVHNLKLEIEDRAGNISPDFLLEITVDTQTPPVQFGDATGSGLAADSDSGVASDPATFVDLITNDTTPTLYGLAEADATVRVFADLDGNGVIDAGDPLLGQTVAVPLDGNQAEPDGYWELTSVIDLNDPSLFATRDGARPLLVWAEDLAGNTNTPNDEVGDAAQTLTIFLDTEAPRIAAVQVTDQLDYDLFDPKPSENGPSPLVRSLTISIADAPFRLPAFIYDAIQADTARIPGNYLLVGDHVGVIPIQSVDVENVFVAGGLITASGTITLNFFEPLPDDRFTLTISDNLSDPAGNHLDGESSADEPQEDPGFASGDGQPGGEFVARFTLDSRPEIGTYVSVGINIDINGNFDWDPSNTQIGNDATNVDLTFTLPLANPATGAVAPGGYSVHDLLVVGQFASGGGLIVGDDAVFVIDISASTTNPFEGGFVGDLNNDGLFDTILDAEIAAFIALNQELIDRGLGNESNVAIVSFSTSAANLDMNPVAPGVQLTTTPLADADGNGTPDVVDALTALNAEDLTNFEAALDQAIDTINTSAVEAGNANVIFLSDGVPTAGGGYADEAEVLRDVLNVNLRAFGVGNGATLSTLQVIDPNAQIFTNVNELLDVFSGGIVGGGGAEPNGFDQLGAFGYSQQLAGGVPIGWRWILDTNSDGVVNPADGDIFTIQPLLPGVLDIPSAIPVAGDYDVFLTSPFRPDPERSAGGGQGEPGPDPGPPTSNGDEIGLYNSGRWAFDTNRNFVIDNSDTILESSLLGHPVVGDFDGDGIDDLGVFNDNIWYFDLAFDGLAQFDANGSDIDDTLVWGFPGVLDRPVAADMDQDGIDDIGLFVPRNSGQLPRAEAEWFFLVSNDPILDRRGVTQKRLIGQINTLDHPFTPVPFGDDLFADFGEELALPIVGNFDPPVTGDSSPGPTLEIDESPTPLADFNLDGRPDGDDFLLWQANWGSTNATFEQGDADRDGDVDGDDFLLWQADFGAYSDETHANSGGGGSVPARPQSRHVAGRVADSKLDSSSRSPRQAAADAAFDALAEDGSQLARSGLGQKRQVVVAREFHRAKSPALEGQELRFAAAIDQALSRSDSKRR